VVSAPAPSSSLGVSLLGNVYTFSSGNGSSGPFSPPVTLTFPYPSTISPSAIKVMFTENGSSPWGTSGVNIVSIGNGLVTVSTTHFSTWAVFDDTFLSSNSSGGGNILAPVPVTAGTAVCLYTAQPISSSTWTIYSVAGYRVASLSFTNQASQCWNTAGVGRGLYYVKLVITFAGGTITEWHKVVVE
jgi:hypothetical protein